MIKTHLWTLAFGGMLVMPSSTRSDAQRVPAYDPPPASRDDRISDEELRALRRPSSERGAEETVPSGLFRELGSDGRVEAYVPPESDGEETEARDIDDTDEPIQQAQGTPDKIEGPVSGS